MAQTHTGKPHQQMTSIQLFGNSPFGRIFGVVGERGGAALLEFAMIFWHICPTKPTASNNGMFFFSSAYTLPKHSHCTFEITPTAMAAAPPQCQPCARQQPPVCASCSRPLIVDVDEDDQDDTSAMPGSSSTRATIPDDTRLSCNCHFHWYPRLPYPPSLPFSNQLTILKRQCLLDSLPAPPLPPTTCPHCFTNLDTPNPTQPFFSIPSDPSTPTWPPADLLAKSLLCDVYNEGGAQPGLDILPLLLEEQYLRAVPGARRCRALLEFCREGDLEAVVDMLRDGGDVEDEDEQMDDENEDDEDEEAEQMDMLRYKDPLGEGQSALHAAVEGGSMEIVWALLWRASRLEEAAFPPGLRAQAEALGLQREHDIGEDKVDIRSLRDARGRSAEQVAGQLGGPWLPWIGTGRLSV